MDGVRCGGVKQESKRNVCVAIRSRVVAIAQNLVGRGVDSGRDFERAARDQGYTVASQTAL